MKRIIAVLFILIPLSAYSQTWDELNAQANEAFNNGDYELAISLGQKALKLAIKKEGKQGKYYGTSLSNLAYYYKNNAEYDKSESYFKETLVLREKLEGKLSSDYVITLFGLGNLYKDLGRYKDAEKCMLESLNLGKQMGGEMSAPYAQFLNGIAMLYRTMGKYDVALKHSQEALKVAKHNYGDEHSVTITCMTNLGSVYRSMGDYILAEKTYLKSMDLKIKTKTENSIEFATILNNLAEVYDKLGEYSKSESSYLKGKELMEKKVGKLNPKYATCLNNIGQFYMDQRNYKEAEKYMMESMEIKRKILGENHPDYAISLNSLGQLYEEMNNFSKAEPYFLQSLAIRKEVYGETHPSYASVLNSLASLYLEEGYKEEARDLYLRAIDINLQVLGEEHENVASLYGNLAETYGRLEDYKTAESYFIKSLKIREKLFGKESEDVAHVLTNLGSLYQQTKSYQNSEDCIMKALMIRKKIFGETHPSYKTTVNHLMSLYLKSGDLKKAMPLLSVCTENFTNEVGELSTFLSEDELERYMLDETASLDVYHSMVWRANNTFPQANSISLDVSLFVRGIQLRSSASLKNDIFNSNDTSLIATYTQWTNYKSQIAQQLSLPLENRTKQLDEWINTANNLEKTLVRQSDAFKTNQTAIHLQWEKVREKLKSDETAIEFVSFQYYDGSTWTDSVFYFAFVVRPNDSIPSYVKLFEEKQLNTLMKGDSLKSFANLLYTDAQIRFINDHDISYGDSLYQLVWKPLEAQLKGVKKIYFAPAGLLHYLSFDAIPQQNQKLLSDTYQLQRLSSIGKIAEEKQPDHLVSSITLYGGLDYNTDTTQLKNLAKNDNYDLTHISRSIIDTNNRGGEWIYLPGTQKEVITVQQLFEKNKMVVTGYSGANGTEETVKGLEGDSSPSILHFSTHGFFFPNPELRKSIQSHLDNTFQTSDNPLLRSGLIMSGGNYCWKGGKPIEGVEDGILTAYEVSNLYLPNTKLVVMSACETGLGDIKGSEGVYGLQRAFKMAGVDYIIVTLWQVLDKETSEFMILFYQNLITKKSIPDAFKLTQDTMKNKYRDEPYKWAGFVLIN